MPEIDRKHCEEVVEWLRTTLESDDISFEVNPQTVAILYSKMKQSQTATKCAESMLRALADAKAEYRSETDRIQTVLSKFGIATGEKFLSKSGTTSLTHLSRMAGCLELNEVSVGTYLMAIQDQVDKQDKLKLQTLRQRTQQEKLELHLASVQEKLAQIDSKLDTFEATRTNCEESVAAKQSRVSKYFEPKCAQYQAKAKQLQAVLHRRGYTPQLEHRALVELGQRVVETDSTIAKLQARKRGYQSLPPDISLAQVEVERSNMQLEGLREQLGKLMELESENINPR